MNWNKHTQKAKHHPENSFQTQYLDLISQVACYQKKVLGLFVFFMTLNAVFEFEHVFAG